MKRLIHLVCHVFMATMLVVPAVSQTKTFTTYSAIPWSGGTTYAMNDMVTVGTGTNLVTYISLIPNNVNNNPASTTGTDWNIVGSAAAGGAVTPNAIAAAIQSQTGCSTAGYVWIPFSNTCVAQSAGANTPATSALLQGGGSANVVVAATTSAPITTLTGVGSAAVSTFQLTLDEIPAGFSINSFTGGQTVEIGATVTNPTFNATYSNTPNSASISNTDAVNSPFALTTPFTNATITGAFSHTTAATVTFTLQAFSTSTKTATQNIVWAPRTFSGAGTSGGSGATASGTYAVLTGATGTLNSAGLNNQASYACTASGNYCYVLMIGGSHTFTSAGFAFPMNTPTAVNFTNANGSVVSMYLYQATNSLTGTFTLVVAS